jgi:hypothetical protein
MKTKEGSLAILMNYTTAGVNIMISIHVLKREIALGRMQN